MGRMSSSMSEDKHKPEAVQVKWIPTQNNVPKVAFKPPPPSCIPRLSREATDKYLKLAQQCLQNVHIDCLTESLNPLYAERSLLDTYQEEGDELRAKGEEVYT